MFIHSRHEIKAVKASCFVMGLLTSFGRFGTKLAVFVSIVTYVVQNDRITAEEVRPGSAIYNIVSQHPVARPCTLFWFHRLSCNVFSKLKFMKLHSALLHYCFSTRRSEVVTPYTKQHIRCRDHNMIKIKSAAVSCNNLFYLMMASSSWNMLWTI
jgi:hypothetical protein